MKIRFKHLNRFVQFIIILGVLMLLSIPVLFFYSFSDNQTSQNETLIDDMEVTFKPVSEDEVRESYVGFFNQDKPSNKRIVNEDDRKEEEDETLGKEIEESNEEVIEDGVEEFESEDMVISIPESNSANEIEVVEEEEIIIDNSTYVEMKPTPTPLPKEKSNTNIEKVKDIYSDKFELINIGNEGFDVKRGDEFVHTYEDGLFGVWKWDDESIVLASKTLNELGVPLSVSKIETNIRVLKDEWKESVTDNNVEFRLGVQNIWVEW